MQPNDDQNFVGVYDTCSATFWNMLTALMRHTDAVSFDACCSRILLESSGYLLQKSGSRVMHVSKDGGNSWDAAQIPAIGQKQFYSLLDMSEDMVFVHVDNVEGK